MQQKDKQRLMEDNINLVYYIVSHDYPSYIHDDDIVQSGMLGLCMAADRYDPEKGKFSTYASKRIRGEINNEFIRRKKHSVAVSLDTPIGNDGTLEDVLMGQNDVDYIDHSFYSQLTTEEQTVFNLSNVGYSSDEIANITNLNIQKVQKILRLIKKKWSRTYAD